jgi:hypothetical protein
MLYKFALFTLLTLNSAFALPGPVQHRKVVTPISLLPPHILSTIFETDLEGIVTARALTSSIFSSLCKELTRDTLFMQLYYPHSDIVVYLFISMIFVYGQWEINEGSQNIKRFKKIDSFNKKEKFIKNMMFIILFVFTKDVLSAT